MNNRYFFLRHGRSIPNEKGFICSTLTNGEKAENSLTPEGMKQIFQTGELLSNIVKIPKTYIFSSPFSRTLHSALILKQVLGLPHYKLTTNEKLIERNFGNFELQTSSNYDKVWNLDLEGKIFEGVESPITVSVRINKFIDDCESNYKDKDIIVVTHGDVIMIARTYFLGLSPFKHRDFPYVDNAQFLCFDNEFQKKFMEETKDLYDF